MISMTPMIPMIRPVTKSVDLVVDQPWTEFTDEVVHTFASWHPPMTTESDRRGEIAKPRAASSACRAIHSDHRTYYPYDYKDLDLI